MKLHLPTALRSILAACALGTISIAHATDYTVSTTSGIIKAANGGTETGIHSLTSNDTATLTADVTGYFNGYSIAADIVMGDYDLTISDGGSNQTYTLSGDLSGNTGTVFGHANSGGSTGKTFKFTGDVSQFKGAFSMSYKSSSLTFAKTVTSGTPNALNASSITAAKNLTFSTAYTVSGTVSTGGLIINDNTTFNNTVSLSTLTIASNATATFNASELNLVGDTITNNGTINLGDTTKLRLETGTGNYAYTYTVGHLTVDGEELSGDISAYVAGLTSGRQTATYSNGVISVEGYTLVWNGNNAKKIENSDAWHIEGTSTNTHATHADNVIINACANGENVITASGLDARLNNVTVNADYRFDILNSHTVSGIFKAAEHEITKSGNGNLLLKSGSEMGSLVVTGGKASMEGDLSKVGNITSKGAVVQTATNGETATHGASIIVQNADGDTIATFSAKQGGAEYTNFYVNGTTDVRPSSGTAVVNNAILEVSGALKLANNTINLKGSEVHVLNEGILTSESTLELGKLTVEAGGSLAINAGKSITYTDSITLALNANSFDPAAANDEGTSTALSTSVLPGTMAAGSTMVLDLSGADITSNQVIFTLTGLNSTALTEANGYDTTANTYTIDGNSSAIFTVNGWSIENITTGANTVLSLSRDAAAIPEPTTATLSLLALAGLAARRRRK